MKMQKFDFKNSQGLALSGRLELPESVPLAVAIFAHCFTCSKSAIAATKISKGLASRGVAVLRFDFTGLGNSEGDFENSHFEANVDDLISASKALESEFMAPKVLIGHSLGGAAVLQACKFISSVESVVTIGAPSETAHVTHLFRDSLAAIEQQGKAQVLLAGREFTISQDFVNTLHSADILKGLKETKKSFLVMHSPIDETVSIEHAAHIFSALKHPRSFISLNNANHLLTNPVDADYCAEMIKAWLRLN